MNKLGARKLKRASMGLPIATRRHSTPVTWSPQSPVGAHKSPRGLDQSPRGVDLISGGANRPRGGFERSPPLPASYPPLPSPSPSGSPLPSASTSALPSPSASPSPSLSLKSRAMRRGTMPGNVRAAVSAAPPLEPALMEVLRSENLTRYNTALGLAGITTVAAVQASGIDKLISVTNKLCGRKLKRAIPDPVSPLDQLLKSVAGEDKMQDCKSKLAAAGVISVQAIQQAAMALLCKVVGMRIAQELKRGADQSLNS